MRKVLGFALLFFAGVFPVLADENLKPPAQVLSTEHFEFAPGGTIRVDGSYGDIYVEGWDQPQVEVNILKLMPFQYKPRHPKESAQHLDALHVIAQKRSATELVISTDLPHRTGPLLLVSPPLRPTTKGDVRLEYGIRVPNNSRLEVHHGVGTVSISGVTGEIQAYCHRGDIVLWLQESGAFLIDAKSKFGKVSSDFTGHSGTQFLL